MNTKKIFNKKNNETKRKTLRKNLSEPEKKFWQVTRGKQLGIKFRRQQGIGDYIADFYSAECQLVIEIDGDSHFGDKAIAHDLRRNYFMQDHGLRVLRFTNQEIMQELDGVLMRVVEVIKEQKKLKS